MKGGRNRKITVRIVPMRQIGNEYKINKKLLNLMLLEGNKML